MKICYLAYAISSYLGYIMKDIDFSSTDALSILRSGYRLYLEGTKSDFEWEKMVTETALHRKIMDVVIKTA